MACWVAWKPNVPSQRFDALMVWGTSIPRFLSPIYLAYVGTIKPNPLLRTISTVKALSSGVLASRRSGGKSSILVNFLHPNPNSQFTQTTTTHNLLKPLQLTLHLNPPPTSGPHHPQLLVIVGRHKFFSQGCKSGIEKKFTSISPLLR